MRGYHYTSWENWQRIQREGLLPYDLTNTSANGDVELGTKGIWTWAEPLQGSSEFGQVLWVLCRRDTEKVVRLSYEYAEHDCYPSPFGCWTWKHKLTGGTVYNETVYHKNAPARVLLHPIPASQIKCERVFELSSTEP